MESGSPFLLLIRWNEETAGGSNSKILMDIHLLHEDLGIVGHHISVHHRAKGNVVAGWLDVLVHQLPEILAPQAVDQISGLGVGAAHLASKNLGVLERLIVDRPAGDGCSALGYGPVEQTYWGWGGKD